MARRSRLVSLITLVAGLVAGCTQFGPYRTKVLDPSGAAVTYASVDCYSGRENPTTTSTLRPCQDEIPGAYAIQHRFYRYRSNEPTAKPLVGEYDMAFVEFDDQGWFANRQQMEALFMLLQKLEANNRHALILVYAHGWKHNASPCDGNVHCFARLVERMDILERHLDDITGQRTDEPPRHVVAVYIGWRGLSVTGGPLANISFWTRKATAERVGRGGVKELLTRLDGYRALRNPDRDEAKTQLVVAGHSFGGLVVHTALAHVLTERAARVRRVDGVTRYQTATSFGDFVVLVNPAFEGSLYEPLFHVATNRCYDARQRPVMMTVTSSGDDATGVAFPLGRGLNTLLEHAGSADQRESIVRTVGHDPRYETHRLELQPRPNQATRGHAKQEVRVPEERTCGCPYLDATEDFAWWDFAHPAKIPLVARKATEQQRAAATTPPVEPDGEKDGRWVYRSYGDEVELLADKKYSANFPYLVVTVSPDIIADHNAIYSEPFVRFLHAFFLLHIADRRPFKADKCVRDVPQCRPGSPIPCEMSCQLPAPENLACTSQRRE